MFMNDQGIAPIYYYTYVCLYKFARLSPAAPELRPGAAGRFHSVPGER
jgi:hypothetical protein